MKYDNKKPPIALIPSEVIEDVSKVFGFGKNKYGYNNWRKDAKKFGWDRHYSSIQRHLNAFWKGEDLDPESGLHHLLHAISQTMMFYIITKEGKNMDNRFKKQK